MKNEGPVEIEAIASGHEDEDDDDGLFWWCIQKKMFG
jgi:hypothetical protein